MERDKIWNMCKELTRELSSVKHLQEEGWCKESIETWVVMQTQDFYNLFNILNDRNRYDARAICKVIEEELEKK